MVSFKSMMAAGAAAIVTLGLGVAAHAQSTFIFNPGVQGVPAGLTLYDDFNDAAGQGLVITSGDVLFPTGDIPGRSLTVPGNTTPYLSIGSGSATIFFQTGSVPFDVRSFAFDYSSVDNYNVLTILYADNTTQTITGADILAGVQSAVPGTTFGNITINGNGALISGLTLSSPQAAFEVDNLSYSAALTFVPEPASWAMMVAGFGLMGVAMRRKRTSVAFQA